jgi:nitrilase
MLIAAAQIAPVFLDRNRTLAKVIATLQDAAARGCRVVAFGETLVPGYPHWLDRAGGARFDHPDLKGLHALSLREAVDLAPGSTHLDEVRRVAGEHGLTVVLGIAERAHDRAGHSIYCSCVVLGPDRAQPRGPATILSVHRKLMPTYEERLAWGIGDGHGLVTHPVGEFRLGALNCWENWMPLARAALHAQGETLHVALWPGSRRNTQDITRFIAIESRSYVLSASALLRESDIPAGVPMRDAFLSAGEIVSDGGSCIAGPDGCWLAEPMTDREGLVIAEIDPEMVRRERQNFDMSGHYARPDVLQLVVDRRRQTVAKFIDA